MSAVRVLGMISGTSHDGIDCALVDLEQHGEELRARWVGRASVPYSPALRSRLRAVLPPASTTLAEVTELDTLIGQEFAAAAEQVVAGAGVDLVVSHGQTVFHWVEDGLARGTLQLGQAAFIAERVGAPVVADVRVADIAAGGQGAPLVPLLDELLLGGDEPTVALNLGGIANLTVLSPGARILAYDVGPANALVDAVVAEHDLDPAGYDTAGRVAAAGRVHEGLLDHLLAEPYYALPAPKSTGKELFHGRYVADAVSAAAPDIEPGDLVATLTELTARTVADAVRSSGARRVVAAGGGCRNEHLMGRLAALLPGVALVGTDELGVPADLKEALAFAVIGWFSLHRLPAAVPGATGAREARVLGAVHQGPHGLELPPRPDVRPVRLRVVA
ncbi:anhydro-N-acetylmuramic acid kinase [Desertihabitans aurantiacus]|uniref:anhydro-N-acetylmuramic acid kinase n=1 Tax=Desertihabitans aurantiacus TaxID=2282477 RepID=UPI001E3E6882|nr:anhydro-N-acetylmuramic acid kinase [Desertihabitans aurantiacus]